MDTRPSRDLVYMAMAEVLSLRSTCGRRSVGCILVDVGGRILGSGYNGVARRQKHCKDDKSACPGRYDQSGINLDGCLAIHAEVNAIMQCQDYMKIDTLYCTTFPCIQCMKLILNTGTTTIVYDRDYPDGDLARTLWTEYGHLVKQLTSINHLHFS